MSTADARQVVAVFEVIPMESAQDFVDFIEAYNVVDAAQADAAAGAKEGAR